MSIPLSLLTAEELTCCCPPDEEAGLGALRTDRGNLPLKLLDVDAEVTGLLSHVQLRQTFVNTLGVPLEATYIFPLPDRAAVSAFRLEVGERVVQGVLQERGQARRAYDQAIAAGHRAAITEEERPSVFTLRVGNLMPGEEASVFLTLSGPLPYADGEATFRFPLVVAPRYIPGAALDGQPVGDGVSPDTDAVPDASRISPPVLLPGFPNPVQLSLRVALDPAGLPLGAIRSSLHAVTVAGEGAVQRIELRAGERLDRDFVLRFQLASDGLGSSLELCPDADGEGEGTFQLTVVPPLGRARGVRPRDVVLLLDRSGSMEGWKMIAARRACARMIDSLTDRDRFDLLAFDDRIERPAHARSTALVEATDRNRFRAVEFLAKLEARGGTELAAPLREAARELLSRDEPGRERIVVLITDGQVGNEDQILRALGAQLEQLRVFSLGIDQAVNAGFLRRLASLGGGYCELVESEDRLDEVMDKVHRRIGTPLLTDLALAGAGGLELLTETVVPRRLPDLFHGTPLRITGRYRGGRSREAALEVQARDAGGLPWRESLRGARAASPAVPKVWARGLLRELEDRFQQLTGRAREDLAQRMTELSLRFGVLSRFTAFVAVDKAEVVNRGGQVHQVTQAVELPRGWAQAPGAAPAMPVLPSMAPPRVSRLMARPPSPGDAPVTFAAPSGAPFGGGGFGVPPTKSASFEAMDIDGMDQGYLGSGARGGDPFASPAIAGGSYGDDEVDRFLQVGDHAPSPASPAASTFGGDPFAAPEELDLDLEAADPFAAPEPFGMPAPAADPFGADAFSADPFGPPAGDPFGGDPFAAPPPAARRPAPAPRRSAKKSGRGSDKAREREQQPDLLRPYRRRAGDLLERLRDVERLAARALHAELAALLTALETLLEDLRSVGADAAALRPLEGLVRLLAVLRARRDLDAAELARLAEQAREALQGFRAEPGPAGSRGGAFWM